METPVKPTKEQFLAAILKIERFSPAPRVLSKALGLLRNPTAELDDIVALIRSDAALSADIIRGANSAFYGAGERVSSLERALQEDRFPEGHPAAQPRRRAPCRRAQPWQLWHRPPRNFWAESQFHGLLLEALAKETGAVSPDDAHTAGLLRYIGRLAINQSIDDLGGGLFWDTAVPVAEWELENVGVTQEQAGAMLLKHWQFPDATVQAIEYQQELSVRRSPTGWREALAFAAVVLPAGSEGSAKFGRRVLATTVPALDGHHLRRPTSSEPTRSPPPSKLPRTVLSAV
jgi:HD-like signal output (HDOD) protein